MVSLRVTLLFVLVKCVLSDQDALLEPCFMQDMECLSRATEQFLEKTCKGIPNYDIRAIDPLVIPHVDYEVDQDLGIVFHFNNLNITGLRNQKISEFKMDTTAKSVLLKTKADLRMVGDLTIELRKQSKSFTGTTSIITSSLGTANYNYDLKKDDKGVEHFEVGPETITCETIGVPNMTMGPELFRDLTNDVDGRALKAKYEIHHAQYHQKTVCRIIKEAYITVVHNIRVSAKILPKTAFFKDI